MPGQAASWYRDPRSFHSDATCRNDLLRSLPIEAPALQSTLARGFGQPGPNVPLRCGCRPVITLARVGEQLKMRCVKAIQPQAGGGQRVEVGRLIVGMAVVARVTPTLVVAMTRTTLGRVGASPSGDRRHEITRALLTRTTSFELVA